jgi:hypothetical protein
MKTYTGFGDNSITANEANIIREIAATLKDKGYTLISGNNNGADITFQQGADKECVIMLPWLGYLRNMYDPVRDGSRAFYDTGLQPIGQSYAEQYIDGYDKLKYKERRLAARSTFYIKGFDIYPTVDFVLACYNEDEHDMFINTTLKVAADNNITVFNIRNRSIENIRAFTEGFK